MKRLLLAITLGFVFIAPTYAESAHEICTQEVRDAGIEDQEEVNAYMQECVAQVSADMQNQQESNESDMENSAAEAEPPSEES